MLATTCLRSALIASAQCCDSRINSFSATGKCLPNVGVWEELFCECNALFFYCSSDTDPVEVLMAEEGNYFNLIIFLFHLQIPEIFSITPNVVSLYGTNHAVLLGHNLGDVSGVRIQTHTDCAPKE